MPQLAPLHTPDEMRRISDFAHVVEGVVLGVAATIAFAQAVRDRRVRRAAAAALATTPAEISHAALVGAVLLWPALVLGAGLFLLGYLLVPHHGAARASAQWAFVFGDPQQRQHLLLALLAIAGGAGELLYRVGRFRGWWWQLAWPMAVATVGIVFAAHTQHGTHDSVAQATLIHRSLGVLLIATGLLRIVELVRGASASWSSISWPVTLFAAALLLVFYREPEGAYDAGRGQVAHDAVHPSTADPAAGAGAAESYAATDSSHVWNLADVERRLREAEVVVDGAPDPVSQPFMSVSGTVLGLGAGGREGDLQVFLYPDVRARERDVAQLDTTRVAPPTMMITWRARPSLLTRENVAAILLTDDDALRRRVREALESP